MSALGAALWVTGIHTAFLWLLMLMVTIKASASRDLVSQLLCQLAAYGLGIFLLLRTYGPESAVHDFLAVRRTAAALLPLGAVLGAALAIPASWLLERLTQRWPPAEPGDQFAELLSSAGTIQQWMIAAGVVVVGPLAEEALFRGALFGPLRKRYGRGAVIVVTSVLFAAVHMEPRRMVPIFAVGVIVGYLRSESGSLWPALAAHLGFNALPVAELLTLPSRGTNESGESAALVLSSTVIAAIALGAIHLIARHHPAATHARSED